MTDSASQFTVYLVNRDGPGVSESREGWTRDPLHSCTGLMDGGTCLVHGPRGVCATLAPKIGDSWTPPNRATVSETIRKVAQDSLDKQLSLLLDLYKITKPKHRTSIRNSVFAGSREQCWPFEIHGEPYPTELFDHFVKKAQNFAPSHVCADVTLIPRWLNIRDSSKTQFAPLIHTVVQDGSVRTMSAEGSEDRMKMTLKPLTPAKVSDSARLPFGSDHMGTARARHEFMYAASDSGDISYYKEQQNSETATNPPHVQEFHDLDEFCLQVMTHKQAKQHVV